MLLYKYLKALQRKDQSALRQSIIGYYKAQSLTLRIADSLYDLTPVPLKFLWSMAFSSRLFFFHLIIPKDHKHIYLGTKKNECDSLRMEFGQSVAITRGYFHFYPNLGFLSAKWPGYFLSFYKIARLTGKKNNLVVFLRSMDYLVISYLFRSLKVETLFHSSEGDPLINALSAIAKKQDSQVVFIDHGPIPMPLGSFPFDKIITTNFRNFTLLKFKYPLKLIVFNGKRSELEGIKINPHKKKIGIIDSLTTDFNHLLFLIKKINSEFPEFDICIRCHPNRKKTFSKCINVVTGNNIEFDECLFVLAGNSGHAVKTLAKSIPVLYDPALDHSPYDLYFLKRDDMLLEQDMNIPFDIGAIADFYTSEKWLKNWNSNF